MKDFSINAFECKLDSNEFCEKVDKIIRMHGLENEMATFVDVVKNEIEPFNCHGTGDFHLKELLENTFFKCLLGKIDNNTTLSKYTSWKNLFRICEDNEIAMVSLLGMNDSTESSYTNNYLKQHGCDIPLTISDQYLVGANTFITSFTTLHDDLTMWRLYGNDAKGISLEFQVPENIADDFFLAPVSYAETTAKHNKLDFVASMSNLEIGNRRFNFETLLRWQYFFKPVQYKIEKEIRLLYFPGKTSSRLTWISNDLEMVIPIAKFLIEDKSSLNNGNSHPLYPLTFCGVTLGPQSKNQRDNKEALSIMFRTKRGWTDKNVKTQLSTINNYRSPSL